MTDKNTMPKSTYILFNFIYIAVAMIWFNRLCFSSIGGLNDIQSKWILYVMIITMMIVAIAATIKRRRNFVSIAANVLIPLQTYMIISLWEYLFYPLRIAIIISILLAVGFFAIVILKKGAPLFRKIAHGALGARTIAAVCLVAIMLHIGVNTLLGNGLYREDEENRRVSCSQSDEWTIENKIDIVLNLKPDRWKKLSIEDRIATLSVIKNIEINYLGINQPINLCTDKMDDSLLGYYTDENKTITISISHLKESPVNKVLHTLLHEIFHAYSYQQVRLYEQVPDEYKDMLMFYEIEEYQKEFANYVSGGDSDNYFAYSSQLCEQKANDYATEGVADYFGRILDYELKGE